MNIGKILIITGIVLIGAGIIYYLTGGRVGRLPGDIHVQRENLQVYIPVTTMILLSLVLSLILWLLRR